MDIRFIKIGLKNQYYSIDILSVSTSQIVFAPWFLLSTSTMPSGWSMFTKMLLDIGGDDGDGLPEDMLEKEVDGEGGDRGDALCAVKELVVALAQGQIIRVPYPVLPSLQVQGFERKAAL